MRRFISLSIPLAFVVLIVFLGGITVAPMPAYAQEIILNGPDLSGFNVYFSDSNRELSQFDRGDTGVSRYAGLLRLLGADVFTLEWRKGIPDDADLIVIAGPSSDMSPDMVARLWAYLQNGGRVFLFADPFDNEGALNRALGNAGLFSLTWSDLGLRGQSNVVVQEGELQQIDVLERNSDDEITFQFSGEVPVLHRAFLTRGVNANHLITGDMASILNGEDEETPANLSSLYFDGARSLEIDAAPQDTIVTPLIFTDDPTMYGETRYNLYQRNGFVEYNIGQDTARGDLVLAAAFEAPLKNARMVLVGDVDMLRNGTGFVVAPAYSGSFVFPANVQFVIRSTAWLLGVEPSNMRDLPTPGMTATATITPTPTVTPTPRATATPGAE